MKVVIDRSGCVGCGLCAQVCSSVFKMGANCLAEVYAQPQPDVEYCVKEAAKSCPVAVIKVEEGGLTPHERDVL